MLMVVMDTSNTLSLASLNSIIFKQPGGGTGGTAEHFRTAFTLT